MSRRSFLVTVFDSPARMVVEDVRSSDRVVAKDLREVGAQIARWLAVPPADAPEATPTEAGP